MQQAAHHKGERLQLGERIFELLGLLEYQLRFRQAKGTAAFTTSQLLQADAFGSQSLGQADFRQRRQLAELADAPAVQGLQDFWRWLQQLDRQIAQARRLLSARN